eukprot:PhF_6_TR15120/c0_g1_i1/m.23829
MYSYSLAQLFVNTLKSCVHKKRLEEQQETTTLHVTHLEAASTSAVGISLVEIQDQSPSAHVNHTDDSDHTVVELNSITPQHVTFYSTAGSKAEETTTIDFVGISSTGSFQSSLEDIVREAQAAVLPFRRRLSEVEFAFNVDKDTTNHQSHNFQRICLLRRTWDRWRRSWMDRAQLAVFRRGILMSKRSEVLASCFVQWKYAFRQQHAFGTIMRRRRRALFRFAFDRIKQKYFSRTQRRHPDKLMKAWTCWKSSFQEMAFKRMVNAATTKRLFHLWRHRTHRKAFYGRCVQMVCFRKWKSELRIRRLLIMTQNYYNHKVLRGMWKGWKHYVLMSQQKKCDYKIAKVLWLKIQAQRRQNSAPLLRQVLRFWKTSAMIRMSKKNEQATNPYRVRIEL